MASSEINTKEIYAENHFQENYLTCMNSYDNYFMPQYQKN